MCIRDSPSGTYKVDDPGVPPVCPFASVVLVPDSPALVAQLPAVPVIENCLLIVICKTSLIYCLMKNITVYSGPMCNFCDAAKRLLTRNNLNYNEIDISTKEGLRDEMTKRANGRRTIPQIFFDDYHVGGYQELRELEKTGKLLSSLE